MEKTVKVDKYAIIARAVKGAEYMIKPNAITSLSREDWERIHNFDQKYTDDSRYVWKYIPASECDFSWWCMCFWRLMKTRRKEVQCDLDFTGHYLTITEY